MRFSYGRHFFNLKLACMIEGQFTLSLITLYFAGQGPKTIYQVENGFNRTENCQNLNQDLAQRTNTRACCGNLPTRYPYKPQERSCCGQTTYDPMIMTCCEDLVPRITCD